MENKEEEILEKEQSENIESEIQTDKKTDKNKKQINKLTDTNKELNKLNKELIKKNINQEKEILSLKKEINKINSEYIKKAKSFAEKAQIQLDEFKTAEKTKIDKQIKEIKKYSLQKSAEELVGILNQLNRVISFETNNAEVNAYIQGFKMISTKFRDVLKDAGINEIVAKVGQEFDGSKHQAIDTIKTDDNKKINHIAEIIHNGYRLHDRLLTPVLVKIYK